MRSYYVLKNYSKFKVEKDEIKISNCLFKHEFWINVLIFESIKCHNKIHCAMKFNKETIIPTCQDLLSKLK